MSWLFFFLKAGDKCQPCLLPSLVCCSPGTLGPGAGEERCLCFRLCLGPAQQVSVPPVQPFSLQNQLRWCQVSLALGATFTSAGRAEEAPFWPACPSPALAPVNLTLQSLFSSSRLHRLQSLEGLAGISDNHRIHTMTRLCRTTKTLSHVRHSSLLDGDTLTSLTSDVSWDGAPLPGQCCTGLSRKKGLKADWLFFKNSRNSSAY